MKKAPDVCVSVRSITTIMESIPACTYSVCRSNCPCSLTQEAGVYKKVWYASSCDRKTAEDALIRSAKARQTAQNNTKPC